MPNRDKPEEQSGQESSTKGESVGEQGGYGNTTESAAEAQRQHQGPAGSEPSPQPDDGDV